MSDRFSINRKAFGARNLKIMDQNKKTSSNSMEKLLKYNLMMITKRKRSLKSSKQ